MPALDEQTRKAVDLPTDIGNGYAAFSKRIPLAGAAHSLDSLVAAREPGSSIVDAAGRRHARARLYAVDGSILPRSSRVSPTLTIDTWALRVDDRFVRKQQEQSHVEQEEAVAA